MPRHAKEEALLFGNTTYDKLKFLAQILLPAVGTLYFALADIWGLPKAQEVVGTIVAVDAFLGVLLGLSSRAYNNSDAPYDGEIKILEAPDGNKVMDAQLSDIEDPSDIDKKDKLVFRVTTLKSRGEEGGAA